MTIKELSRLYSINIKAVPAPAGCFFRIVRTPIVNVYRLQMRRKALIGSWLLVEEYILQHNTEGVVKAAQEAFEKWA